MEISHHPNSKADRHLQALVEEALADPEPSIPQAEVFADLRHHHERRSRTNPVIPAKAGIQGVSHEDTKR